MPPTDLDPLPPIRGAVRISPQPPARPLGRETTRPPRRPPVRLPRAWPAQGRQLVAGFAVTLAFVLVAGAVTLATLPLGAPPAAQLAVVTETAG